MHFLLIQGRNEIFDGERLSQISRGIFQSLPYSEGEIPESDNIPDHKYYETSPSNSPILEHIKIVKSDKGMKRSVDESIIASNKKARKSSTLFDKKNIHSLGLDKTSVKFNSNQLIWAKWTSDQYYYPGNIVSASSSGDSCKICFSDDTLKDIKSKSIIEMDLGPGDTIMAIPTPNGNQYEHCFINSKLDNNRFLVYFELGGEGKVVSMKDICLSAYDINSKSLKKQFENGNVSEGDRPVTPLKVKEKGSNNNSPRSLTNSTVLNRTCINKTPKSNRSNIFDGMSFLVTTARPKDTFAAFSRVQIEKQIMSYGGEVIDKIMDFHRRKVKNKSFLIAYDFCRSTKYFYALAEGIPRISYRWIEECLLRVRQHLVI